MRILFAHNRYQLMAGEEAVVQAEAELLQSHNQAIARFEVDNQSISGTLRKITAAAAAVYSFTSRQRILAEIRRFRPDVVHVHNFFPLLSPSIYDACAAAGVPVVQTLHNYRIICPNGKLFRAGNRCEECLGKTLPLPGVLHRCYRDSTLQSAAVAAMITTHNLRKTWQERVDAYITLTQFQKAKMVQAGLPAAKIYVKPNFLFDLPPASVAPSVLSFEPYALFVGRLWEEKGITTLIDAYIAHDIQLPLKVVGDGILRQKLQQQVQQAGLEHRIEFVGWQEKTAVLTLMQNAQAVIFPSVWYETFGLSMIEAFACSVPVIASQLGGIPEIVTDGHTGLLFEAGNANDLAQKLNWAIAHPELLAIMGKNARTVYETRYTPVANYRQLISIYEKAAGRSLH